MSQLVADETSSDDELDVSQLVADETSSDYELDVSP